MVETTPIYTIDPLEQAGARSPASDPDQVIFDQIGMSPIDAAANEIGFDWNADPSFLSSETEFGIGTVITSSLIPEWAGDASSISGWSVAQNGDLAFLGEHEPLDMEEKVNEAADNDYNYLNPALLYIPNKVDNDMGGTQAFINRFHFLIEQAKPDGVSLGELEQIAQTLNLEFRRDGENIVTVVKPIFMIIPQSNDQGVIARLMEPGTENNILFSSNFAVELPPNCATPIDFIYSYDHNMLGCTLADGTVIAAAYDPNGSADEIPQSPAVNWVNMTSTDPNLWPAELGAQGLVPYQALKGDPVPELNSEPTPVSLSAPMPTEAPIEPTGEPASSTDSSDTDIPPIPLSDDDLDHFQRPWNRNESDLNAPLVIPVGLKIFAGGVLILLVSGLAVKFYVMNQDEKEAHMQKQVVQGRGDPGFERPGWGSSVPVTTVYVKPVPSFWRRKVTAIQKMLRGKTASSVGHISRPSKAERRKRQAEEALTNRQRAQAIAEYNEQERRRRLLNSGKRH